MGTINKIYQILMKQYRVDSGQFGGLFTLFMQALSILGLFTFINTSISSYQTFWKFVLPLPVMIIVIILIVSFALWFIHAILYPSSIQFQVKQTYSLHNSPMKSDIAILQEDNKKILEILKRIEEENK
jgi:hypothetical protein